VSSKAIKPVKIILSGKRHGFSKFSAEEARADKDHFQRR
jgi:hypothetical protein